MTDMQTEDLEQPIIDITPSIPSPPDFVEIDPLAKQEWERITPELYAAGVLSSLDMAVLAGYCVTWARIRRLENFLLRFNMSTSVGKKGYVQARPEVAILRENWKLMKTFSELLGLSPVSRHKLGNGKSEAPDPFFD